LDLIKRLLLKVLGERELDLRRAEADTAFAPVAADTNRFIGTPSIDAFVPVRLGPENALLLGGVI
jgi:hypothetical protein